MRTAEPGQAAGSVGEGRPPKVQGPAWAPILGRGTISPGLSQIVERYQFTARVSRAAGLVRCGRSCVAVSYTHLTLPTTTRV